MVSFGITIYLGLRSLTGPLVWHGYRYDSSDSRDPRSPIVLVFPPGSLQTSRGRGKGKGKLASDQK
ncbi:hypothetical protein E5676_scaffold447G00330 [Cucumis melo var. makuwa]|uniref:Uncharacterized protein n=1 Tax=Cucumis melo var. makuwa TaxID=1194695 RepID=A0A5A7SI31_CUCMM|nr:hypothetical protein E6C27_scaffold34G00750 [Cucumis melo var. makuwa]TYK09636.1 hypothetical protein E5676_scaffold447G00330 [Cucumis melo var. makuwa]